jgi:hypothetical protein
VRTTKWLVMLIVACLCACGDAQDDKLFYCGTDGGASGKMQLDLAALKISGADTSSSMEPFSTDAFAGFRRPFPILLFDESLESKNVPQSVGAAGYQFTFQSLQSEERDWWMIAARPNADSQSESAQTKMSSTILYSPSQGVLAIHTAPLGEGRLFVSQYVPCGPRALQYADLSQAARPPQ